MARSEQEFHGKIDIIYDESEPWWAPYPKPPEGARNVLFIVLDDVGFSQLSCYGGLCETPNLDRLAQNGLRYNNFHTTALCSPTRACLLTGRNHHSNGMACITEGATGFPGYNGRIPFRNGFLSEMLLPHGYNTFAIGKWHLTPVQEASPAGPFDRWPLGRGFERFYGFLGGESNQWYPDLVYDNHSIEPPKRPEEGYHLTEDLVDRAIEFIQDAHAVAPERPFFLYFCPGACHAPHHVPREWADRYRGKFDMGWDRAREMILERQKEMGIVPANTELSPRPEEVQAWDTLSGDEKRLYARMMEVFAGFLTHTDHHIGRLIAFLEELGELDDTLIFAVSDNGASAEGGPTGSVNEGRFFNKVPESLEDNLEALDELGGPTTYNHYPWGWTLAGNTPLKRWKRETFQGGTTDPMIVHWPKGIRSRGEIRTQYTHAIDLVPTALEALGIEPPAKIRGVDQSPIEGISFRYSFDDANAPSRRVTQYFEMFAHRAIYHDGWRAVIPHPFGKRVQPDDLQAENWELYHVAEDFSEVHDLADKEPRKVQEMMARWWAEAGKYNVLPLDGRAQERIAERKPQIAEVRESYTYYPGGQPISESVAVDVKNRSHTITAEVEIPDEGAEGVLLAMGSRFGGYSLFVKDRRLHYVHNYVGVEEYRITSTEDVPAGITSLRYVFNFDGGAPGSGGTGELYFNGRQVGEGRIPRTVPIAFTLAGEGLCCGWDNGEPVSAEYESPFRFTGQIRRVIVDVSGVAPRDLGAEMDMALSRQ